MITKIIVKESKRKRSQLSEIKDGTLTIFNYKRWREVCTRIAKVLSDRKNDS